jgi:hypothetical protein
MKKRPSLPILVLVAVVALVLGSFGTAVAGPAVTKGQVKKIAKKVVNKAAPTLSVAHATTATTATTATNATNLNGLAASTYQENAIVVALPNKVSATSSVTYTLPAIPAGNYAITINYSANLAAAGQLSCILNQAAVPTALIWAYAGNFNGVFQWINGSRVAAVGGGALTMFCTSGGGGGNFTTPIASAPGNVITFQPLDNVTSGGTATQAKPAGEASLSGR